MSTTLHTAKEAELIKKLTADFMKGVPARVKELGGIALLQAKLDNKKTGIGNLPIPVL